MSFYKWFKSKSDRELQEAVNNDADKGLNERKNKLVSLYGVYLQEKMFKETKNLVKATWVLVLVTAILAIANIIFIFAKG